MEFGQSATVPGRFIFDIRSKRSFRLYETVFELHDPPADLEEVEDRTPVKMYEYLICAYDQGRSSCYYGMLSFTIKQPGL